MQNKLMIYIGSTLLLIVTLVSGIFIGNYTHSSKVEGISQQATPISLPTNTPTELPTPTIVATPTTPILTTSRPVVKTTPMLTSSPQPTSGGVDKQTLNDYSACKESCPLVKSTPFCTHTDEKSSCTIAKAEKDRGCIDVCNSKYGLNF